MKTVFSTEEVANKIGIHRVTLQNWITNGKIHPSQRLGPKGQWVWTEDDVKEAMQYWKDHFRDGQGKRNDIKGKKKVRKAKSEKK